MRVVFGNLDDMVFELRDKLIKEVRVEALHDCERAGVAGVTPDRHRYYVTVEALLFTSGDMKAGAPAIYGHFEQTTDGGTTWSVEGRGLDWESISNENLQAKKEIRELLESRGFTVRAGLFEEA